MDFLPDICGEISLNGIAFRFPKRQDVNPLLPLRVYQVIGSSVAGGTLLGAHVKSKFGHTFGRFPAASFKVAASKMFF